MLTHITIVLRVIERKVTLQYSVSVVPKQQRVPILHRERQIQYSLYLLLLKLLNVFDHRNVLALQFLRPFSLLLKQR